MPREAASDREYNEPPTHMRCPPHRECPRPVATKCVNQDRDDGDSEKRCYNAELGSEVGLVTPSSDARQERHFHAGDWERSAKRLAKRRGWVMANAEAQLRASQ